VTIRVLSVGITTVGIFLLGFDMKVDSAEKQHWHDLYGKIANRNPRKPYRLPFERHLRGFPAIYKDSVRLGIEIINVSPDSAINEFKKVSLSECY
jgi:hypothetical protein